MNKTFLKGNLTKDPEIRYGQPNQQGQSTAVARYRIGVRRAFVREGGPDSDFIDCVAFGKNAEFAEKYLHKGMAIIVEGRIQTGNYTNKEGQKVYYTEIVVEHHEFCGPKPNNGDSQNNGQAPQNGGNPNNGYQNNGGNPNGNYQNQGTQQNQPQNNNGYQNNGGQQPQNGGNPNNGYQNQGYQQQNQPQNNNGYQNNGGQQPQNGGNPNNGYQNNGGNPNGNYQNQGTQQNQQAPQNPGSGFTESNFDDFGFGGFGGDDLFG